MDGTREGPLGLTTNQAVFVYLACRKIKNSNHTCRVTAVTYSNSLTLIMCRYLASLMF